MTIDDTVRTRNIWLTEEEVPADWEVGDILLDLYEVTGILGEGGMGKVYQVHHRGWNLAMAVKNPRPELFRLEEGRATFILEAQTWVNLGLHPNTVSCYYVRTLGAIPRVFAECVEGGSLLDWVWYGHLYKGTPKEVVARVMDVAIQMAWGLHHAHQAGLLHQDVKSSNILMTKDGVAKVTDFGLAVAMQAVNRYVNPDDRVMTPEYASPEQANGHPLDLRSDLYSWAVICVEMVTRDQPRYGPDELTRLLQYRELEMSGQTPMSYPTRFLQLLEQCLQRNPEERPRDLAEVANALIFTYQELMGQAYSRRVPVAAERQIDSMNNRAVSLVDLGHTDEAVHLLQEALELDPTHLHAVHNLSLLRWRVGRMTEERMLSAMREARAANPSSWEAGGLMGWVHLERGDFVSCTNVLNEAARGAAGDEAAEAALGQIHSLIDYGSRLTRGLRGHNGDVYSVAMTPDGRIFVSGGADGCVRLWDPATGVCIQNLTGHSSPVAGVCITQDGRMAFSASADTTIRVWDLSHGQCVNVLAHGWSMRHVAVSEDGTWLIAASMDKTLSLWHVPTGRRIRTLVAHTDGVLGVAMAPDGSLCVSASEDKTLRVWDLSNGECMGVLTGHTEAVQGVAVWPDGRWAISASADHTLRIWDLERMECAQVLTGHRGMVKGVAVAAGAGLAVSAGSTGSHLDIDDSVRLWELATGRCIGVFSGHRQSVMGVAIDAAGTIAASASSDSQVGVWTVHPLVAPLALVQPRRSEQILEDQNKFKELIVVAEKAMQRGAWYDALEALQVARNLPGYASAPQVLGMWSDLQTRAERGDLRGFRSVTVLKGHTAGVRRVAISADSRRLLSNGRDGSARLWDLTDESNPRTVVCAHPAQPRVYGVIGQSVPPEGGYGLALTSDGSMFLTAAEDHSIKVWEASSGRQIRSLAGHTDMINCLTITPDNRLAASASADGTVRLWQMASGKCLQVLQGMQGWSHWVDITPDGRTAISSHTDARLRVWDVVSNRVVRTLEGSDGVVTCVVLTADGQTAISGGLKRTLRVWDVREGTCKVQMTGHQGGIYGLCLSSDGKLVLSASDDKTLKLWEVSSGKCLQTFDGNTAGINACAMSPDGRLVVSAGEDQTLRLWHIDWNLVPHKPVDFDEGARSALEIFLTLHTRPGGFMRKAAPSWTDADFTRLMVELGYQGFGWLRAEGVQKELKRMATTWTGPAPFGT